MRLNKEYNNVVEQFAKEMENSFITPKAITPNHGKKAYMNLIPSEIVSKKIRLDNDDLLYNSDNVNKKRTTKKLKDDKGYFSAEIKKKEEEKNLAKNYDDIVLGQHSGFSFYECYAREIIFQLFEYPLMSYHKYDLLITEEESIPQLNWMKNPNYHSLKTEEPKKRKEPNKSIKGIFGNNLQPIKEIEKGNETDFHAKTNISLKGIESSDNENIINSKKNKKNKKKKIKFNISSSEGVTQTSSNNKTGTGEKNKEENNKNKKKENGKSNSMPKHKNESDEKSMQQISGKQLSHSNNNKDKLLIKKIKWIKGDFDFLIHSLKGSVLENVLTNKEVAPFIFYGNFVVDKEMNYDIIGEIKENSDSHDALIEQAEKYLNLIRNFPKNPYLNKKLCFKKENQKIIMYVFNSKYHNFIKDILDFKINRNRFKEIAKGNDNQYLNTFVNSFSKFKYEYRASKRVNGLLSSIINSGIPFVFIFVQNIMKLFEIKEKENNKLKEEINSLNQYIKGLNRKNNEYKYDMQNKQEIGEEELKISFQETIKEMKEKILALESEKAKEKEERVKERNEREKMKLEIEELKEKLEGKTGNNNVDK